MDYEKRYKEALERAKYYQKENGSVVISAIFPELKESEDDKIVDAIRKALEAKIEDLGNGVTKTACINWLEKQCKQKINLVEILKHYPKETELYSPLYGKLWLAEVDEENEIITCYKHPLNKGCTRAILGQEDTISFYSDGTIGLPDFSVSKDCMLFLYDIEKQGKQKSQGKSTLEAANEEKVDNQNCVKSTNKIEPKFHEGDFIKHNKANIICKVISVDSGSYYVENIRTNSRIELFNAEQNFHLWTIEDANEGDVLTTYTGRPFIFKGCLDERHPNSPVAYCGVNYDNCFFVSSGISWWTDENVYPATKEQHDLLFQKMKEASYEWDAEKKELIKIEDENYNGEDYGIDSLFHAQRILEKTLGKVEGYQSDDGILEHKCAISAVKKLYEHKSAWSEEDSPYYDDICEILINLLHSETTNVNKDIIQKDLNWLVSIKNRVIPQPKQEWSKKDEKMFDYSLDMIEWYGGKNEDKSRLVSNWLKSLKQRYTWKPSDEQMNLLEVLVEDNSQRYFYTILKSLYEQLKKLREE